MSSAAINYSALEMERSSVLQEQFERRLNRRLTEDLKGLRYTVLASVVAGNYDQAAIDIEEYIAGKEEFPLFKHRIERYVGHSKDLIRAIESKRNFPGIHALATSKQQEVFEKVIEHFDELKQSLTRIQATGHEVRLDDIRSTVIFLRASMWSIIILVFLGFFLDLTGGLIFTYHDVAEHIASVFTEYVFDNIFYR